MNRYRSIAELNELNNYALRRLRNAIGLSAINFWLDLINTCYRTALDQTFGPK